MTHRQVLGTEDRTLIYVCGAQVVILSIETKEQAFISGGRFGISSIYYQPVRKVIAVAERGESTAVVTLYEATTLRKKKVLQYPELGSPEVVSTSLSEDGRLCVTQGGAPEWNLVLWNIEKSAKVVGTVRVPVSDEASVTQVSFCPWDPSVIIALGKGLFKLFRVAEGQLRPATLMVRREQSHFLSHCWVGGPGAVLLVGTEGGEILLIENMEFRAVLFPPAGAGEGLAAPIYCFGMLSSGALLAGTSNGTLRYFTKTTSSKEPYAYAGSYRMRDKDRADPGALHADVLSLAMNADDSFSVATSAQQLLSASVNHLNADKDSSVDAEQLLTSFHGPGLTHKAAVTGLDTALWRAVMVSCGKDRTVRVWSVGERRLELVKRFDEEPTSVSLHPSGLYLAVGFEACSPSCSSTCSCSRSSRCARARGCGSAAGDTCWRPRAARACTYTAPTPRRTCARSRATRPTCAQCAGPLWTRGL